ncbi:MAG: hypothetical protein U5K79_13220 [Cyclobacteriaceae bacterium]|nr:hypothetical protein [Cyclobacteriaceae bacterium]
MKSRGELKQELDSMLLARHLAALMKGIGTLYAFAGASETPSVTFSNIIDQLFDQIEIKERHKNFNDEREQYHNP